MTRETVVYLAGSDWGGVAGTDRRLATALGRIADVLWVEPPVSVVARLQRGTRLRDLGGSHTVARGVTALQIVAPPFASRRGLRGVSNVLRGIALRRFIGRNGLRPTAIMLSSPRERFPAGVAGVRGLYVTDDWAAGAEMMGLSGARVAEDLAANVTATDAVFAVSPVIAHQVADVFAVEPEVLANGCELPAHTGTPTSRGRHAIVVGQLNERIDVDLLAAVVAAGVALVVIGPRTVREPAAQKRLDALLTSPGVTWLGELPAQDLAAHLADASVGLTPYVDNAFNRSSFPLKTLEYLAHGLPVVSTPLPAVDWLATDHIAVGRDRAEFVARVLDAVDADADPDADQERRAFAAGHSWDARAAQLIARFGELQRLGTGAVRD